MRLLCTLIVVLSLCASAAENVSKKELFLRARDALKTSLETGDKERASTAFDYLKANVDNGAPLTVFEEYLCNMELERFEEGIKIYANMRRSLLDTNYLMKVNRVISEDMLQIYLYRGLKPFTSKVADSLYARVESAEIRQDLKDLYRVLLYSELAITADKWVLNQNQSFVAFKVRDMDCVPQFLEYAKDYVQKNPMSEHSLYLNGYLVPKIQKQYEETLAFRKDPFYHKYYTGGISVYAMTWLPALFGDMGELFDNNTEFGDALQFEVELQFRRFFISGFLAWGMSTELVSKSENRYSYDDEEINGAFGLNAGVTVYDSRYLRVSPFIGFSNTDWYNDQLSTGLLLGTNVDFRIAASTPRYVGQVSCFANIRFKYSLDMGSVGYNYDENGRYSENAKDQSYFIHRFAIGIGFGLW
ncbi:MAG: hypothetical protein HUK20_09925 [Fibrobacter sp.]|nr:hypothetical protein [Fibrobacter sp.]